MIFKILVNMFCHKFGLFSREAGEDHSLVILAKNRKAFTRMVYNFSSYPLNLEMYLKCIEAVDLCASRVL